MLAYKCGMVVRARWPGMKLKSTRIESIHVEGFRSLADVEILDLHKRAAVLIGPNGSGKSNFLRFFEMVKSIVDYRDLDSFVDERGRADDQLFMGSKVSPEITAEIVLRSDDLCHECQFVLEFSQPDRLKIAKEEYRTSHSDSRSKRPSGNVGKKIVESPPDSTETFKDNGNEMRNPPLEFVEFFKNFAVHQFHDTSFHSALKKSWDSDDHFRLLPDGGNLAPVLLRIEREDPDRFLSIRECVRGVLPTFDRFEIEERSGKALLRWKPKGHDKTIGAHLTSDGTLRFFALATLLNLPPHMLPSAVFLDEPELGLHPAAISVIGELVRLIALDRQVIVAAQSPLLVDEFELNEIVVFESQKGRTQIRRFDGPGDQDRYRSWLERYSTGELWQKNVLGGRP